MPVTQKVDHDMRRIAQHILREFDNFYSRFCAIPEQAKAAFENMAPAESLALSRQRLGLYSQSLKEVADELKSISPGIAQEGTQWSLIEPLYYAEIVDRYEEDLAIAYIHSMRRIIFDAQNWEPVDYQYHTQSSSTDWLKRASDIVREYPGGKVVTAELVQEILQVPGFSARFRLPDLGAESAAARINQNFGFDQAGPSFQSIKIIDVGFYRNRGAYIVGSIVTADGNRAPLVISMENSRDGLFIDAVLNHEADAHNIFSSTLANFHVTNQRYHEIAALLHEIMPGRALGLHYSTIGYNHLGKVAVMEELGHEIASSGECFATAVGFRGSVAIGFSTPGSSYVLKVIRDTPTSHYKWDEYPGGKEVLKKYSKVHEINRTGSMLDNIIYQRVPLEPSWFDNILLEELTSVAANTVTLRGGKLEFSHLIVQPKMIPIPVYLKTSTREEAETAIINLGDCIKNNAAANIFNRDLDARNYGVSHYGKVYLFDYDAVERLTDVKIRTNLDREDGEDEIPDWFFEEGVIFLPEEIETGLGIADRNLRHVLRQAHPDLLTTGYWLGMQRALNKGLVPRLTVYPSKARI